MFEVTPNKVLPKGLHRIVSNFTLIFNDGENDCVYFGTNEYNQKILGVIIYEDNDTDTITYSHVLLTEKLLIEFLNKTISYLNILQQVDSLFIVSKNYQGEEIDYNVISFESFPAEFKPLENSFCPDYYIAPSFNYGISLQGNIADQHLAIPEELNNVNTSFNNFISNSLQFARELELNPKVYVEALQMGSFRINFKISFEANQQSKMFNIPEEKLNAYFNEYIKYVFNDLPKEDIDVFKGETVESESFEKLELSLTELYNIKSIAVSEGSIEHKIIDSISFSVKTLDQLKYNGNFDKVEIINYSKNENELPLAIVEEDFVSSVEQKLFRERETKVEDVIVIDEAPVEYTFQVNSLNLGTGNGGAFYNDGKGIIKISLHARGKQNYGNTILTQSMHEQVFVKSNAKGKRVNSILKEITIEF